MSWAETKWLLDQLSGGFQEFTTPGSHTFTVPNFVSVISITACAGGGGGSRLGGFGGGGGEAVVNYLANVTGGETISITVGAGGVGAVNRPTSDATNGSNTVIGSILTLLGGQSGDDIESNGAANRRGGGVGGYNNNLNSSHAVIPATDGIIGRAGTSPVGASYGGNGGGSLGDGGNGAYIYISDYWTVPTVGTLGGGGGAGSADSPTLQRNGANGGDGYVRISWGIAKA